jgi:transposase InsO family protein
MKRYRSEYTVAMMSKVIGVSSSGYYKWLQTNPDRSKRIRELDSEIKVAYSKSFMTYGSPRIAQVLKQKKIQCSKSTVARRMKVLCLTARPKRKYITTTDSDHNYKVADNLLNREFAVDHINKVWVSDITYIKVASSWMYLTTMIDLADRMVVGWSLSNNMTTTDTVNHAFIKAIKNRGISKETNLMIHSDRGVQYASDEFRLLIKKHGCYQSMSRKGNCWDNAVAESFFKTIKIEALNRYIFKDSTSLNKVIFRYIDGWYNTVRIHTALDGLSPAKASKLKTINLAA